MTRHLQPQVAAEAVPDLPSYDYEEVITDIMNEKARDRLGPGWVFGGAFEDESGSIKGRFFQTHDSSGNELPDDKAGFLIANLGEDFPIYTPFQEEEKVSLRRPRVQPPEPRPEQVDPESGYIKPARFDKEMLANVLGFDSPKEVPSSREFVTEFRNILRNGTEVVKDFAQVTREITGYASDGVNDRLHYYGDKVGIHVPERPVRTVAAGFVLAGTIAAGLQVSPDEKELAQGDAPTELEVIRTGSQTKIKVPGLDSSSQDAAVSIHDVARALDISPNDVRIEGEELAIQGDITPGQVAIAAIAASAPDSSKPSAETTTTTTEVQPASTLAPNDASQGAEEVAAQEISPENMSDEEFMDWLVSQTNVTAEDYKNFTVDESYAGVFDDELSGKHIKPTAFVLHWTAGKYKNGVEQFISAIKGRKGNCCNVMYFIDDAQSPTAFRFTKSWEMTSHAKGANSYTQGVEVEAENLRGYTPAQMKTVLMLALRFMDANDIPIERDNFLGHAELTKGKIDGPAYLMDRLFLKLQQLANDVHGNIQSETVENPENGNPATTYESALNALLEYIASGEGDWDSINRGTAGDTLLSTPSGRAKYKAIFGDRMLTDLTLDEVMQLQRQGTIKAVGKFQLIPGTLAAAVKTTGIDTGRKYDAATQLELARDYLLLGGKQKRLTAYLKGESDDLEAAIEGLCAEWASLVCNNGIGRYNGVAGNNAHGGEQKLNEQKQLLIALRSAYIAAHQPVETPDTTVPATTTTSQPTVTTTTSVVTETAEAQNEERVIRTERVAGAVYLDKDGAMYAYQPFFKSHEDLQAWVDSLPRISEDGGEKYEININNLPKVENGGSR